MANVLPIVVKSGFELFGTDNIIPSIDLTFIDPNSEMSITADSKTKCEGKEVVQSIVVNCSVNASRLKTSVIDGSSNVCVSITGNIMGSSSKVKSGNRPLCLADPSQQGTIATLQAAWSNSSSGASGVVPLKCWFKKAGQDSVKGI